MEQRDYSNNWYLHVAGRGQLALGQQAPLFWLCLRVPRNLFWSKQDHTEQNRAGNHNKILPCQLGSDKGKSFFFLSVRPCQID